MIKDLTFPQQSLLFAQFSEIAYLEPDEANPEFAKLGYKAEFIDEKQSEAYLVSDKNDFIIVCRGTQPNKLSDILADLRAIPVKSTSGIGLVHKGFKDSVDHIWPKLEPMLTKIGKKKSVWCTGHSLGAAMATLIAVRCRRLPDTPNPEGLFTYGSPRVGDNAYVGLMTGMDLVHHRWVNNADIVTKVPALPFFHYGELHYMNHWGNVREMNGWQMFKDRLRGFWVGLKRGSISYFGNHSITRYRTNLENFAAGQEREQI